MRLLLASSLTGAFSLVQERFMPVSQGNKVLFIANAADPFKARPWVDAERERFVQAGYELTETDLRAIDANTFNESLRNHHLLHVCGGSVFHLLSLMKKSGAFALIQSAVQEGVIAYSGSSAGSIVAARSTELYKHDQQEQRFLEDAGNDFAGLGFVNFLVVPHSDDPKTIEDNKTMVAHLPEHKLPLIFLRDSQAILIENGRAELLSANQGS